MLSANGTYGPGCTDRSGFWSVAIVGTELTYPVLSVIKNNEACELTLVSLDADQLYTAAPAMALGGCPATPACRARTWAG